MLFTIRGQCSFIAHLSDGRVQDLATGLHEVAEALEVFRLVGKRLFLAADQELLTAPVEYGVVDDLELAELADELDVAEHLALGQVLGVLLVPVERRGGEPLELLGQGGAILELISALIEEQPLEGAGLVGRVEIGRFLHEPPAQLCVHRRVLRFIEGFFENLWTQTETFKVIV